MGSITIRALAPGLAADYLDFFDKRAFADNPEWSDCYCRFFQARTIGEWERATAADNRAAAEADIKAGKMSGCLAFQGDAAVGWCASGPKSAYPLLATFPGIPGSDDSGVAAIVCLIVEKDHRHKGVGRALVDAAIRAAASAGFASIESYPRLPRAGAGMSDAEAYPGPVRLYEGFGFARLRDAGDRIVMALGL